MGSFKNRIEKIMRRENEFDQGNASYEYEVHIG